MEANIFFSNEMSELSSSSSVLSVQELNALAGLVQLADGYGGDSGYGCGEYSLLSLPFRANSQGDTQADGSCSSIGTKLKYICNLCGENFTQKGSLGTHIRVIHEKIRKHKCCDCRRRFGQKGDLHRHINTVHEGKRNYKCVLCSCFFSRKFALKRHISRKHIQTHSVI